MPQGNVELMTEKHIFGLKPAPQLEQVGDEHFERAQIANIIHQDAMILPYDANPAGWSFRKGQELHCANCAHAAQLALRIALIVQELLENAANRFDDTIQQLLPELR